MNPAPDTSASLLRRYTAWSLDAVAISALVVVVMHRPLHAAWRTCDRTIDALFQSMVAAMQTVELDASPMALAQIWVHDPALQVAITALALAMSSLAFQAIAGFALMALLWFTAFEGSRWQATPGKRVLGLQVVNDIGLPPGYVRAGLRTAAGLLSWLSFNIGHLLALHAPRHQALHDRIAGTRVVRRGTAPMPMAARLWVWLQPAAGCLLLALLMRHLDRSMAAALTAVLGA
jgi:uncharacterized RDD family membrane protein YckC